MLPFNFIKNCFFLKLDPTDFLSIFHLQLFNRFINLQVKTRRKCSIFINNEAPIGDSTFLALRNMPEISHVKFYLNVSPI